MHKPNIRKFEKWSSSFKNNTWEADLANIQLTGIFNKGLCFLFCTLDIYSKHSWVVPLKNKKSIIRIASAFQKVLDDFNGKLNTIWVDKRWVANFTIDEWNHDYKIMI